jgi:hypothetical protein
VCHQPHKARHKRDQSSDNNCDIVDSLHHLFVNPLSINATNKRRKKYQHPMYLAVVNNHAIVRALQPEKVRTSPTFHSDSLRSPSMIPESKTYLSATFGGGKI